MKKILLKMLPIIGLFAVLIFGVNSLASVPGDPALTNQTFSEPLNILLVGFGLIASGAMLKSRSNRSE